MPLRGVHPEWFWTPAWEIWVGLWNDLGDIGVCQAHRLSPCIMMSRINFHAESRKFNRRLIRRTRPEAMGAAHVAAHVCHGSTLAHLQARVLDRVRG